MLTQEKKQEIIKAHAVHDGDTYGTYPVSYGTSERT